ncbi:gluconate 2-dehydrogenase subunit 3 family protein [Cytobacillus purgationiresistens]|uniref:Gluconate 2-dehydrogenase gamma chain n=1 Tax=Cytobacillus purgationiresistens TaxID=863449 RepID=A0ABU0AGR0_9BACI|nr:gluconate 2-dehydrogenase subunit 3 family protein [Cytobacillus purgationiresistens]MDQ0270446.1 gluconate 2-dehydrogenase gamma chain [Cytobacillus purgationiresistens]
MSENENQKVDHHLKSRRTFLKNSGLTVGGIVLGGAVANLLGVNTGGSSEHVHTSPQEPVSYPNEALMFFTMDQYRLTAAAAERIFPKDELGPGAIELNVAIYIDHQLASPWGANVKDYMQGPFYSPDQLQGTQLRLLRKDLFLLGLEGLDKYSNKKFKKNFIELEVNEQDEVLTDFESGEKYKLSGISSSHFFSMLRTLTIEGAYADPLYGGNKEMKGWKMRKYPGSYMSYTNDIQSNSFVEKKPQSLNSHMGH